MKGISREDFPENWVGRLSYNFMSEEPMNFFGKFSNKFASEGSPIFSPKLGVCFREQKSFVLKTVFFSHLA